MSRLTNEIDVICDAFEARFRAGESPRAEEHLGRSDQPRHRRLLAELLAIELTYRMKSNAPLSAEEVAARFPDEPSLFQEVAQESGGASAEDQRHVAPGKEFGDYELLEEIARGGMGVVYRARHRSLGRMVALKMILSAHLASPEAVQRFQSEARAAAKLDHPGIVPIYKVGEHSGQHYFTMGLVEGESLADRLKHGPLEFEAAAAIVRDVAKAAFHAHDHGIVHRDLKPANILLDPSDQPKITDFGLAKQLGNEGELTASGQILGTPNYMAPEQARGDLAATSPAVDIHALGALLYCMLTGQAPFQAATVASTLRLVADEQAASPRSLVAAIPRDLETICEKCLEKEPLQRYASAKHVADELQRFLDGRPIMARPVPAVVHVWRWIKRHPAIALLSTGLLVAMLVGTLLSLHFANRSRIEAQKERIARQEADRARDEAQDVADFILSDMFGRATPHHDGADLKVVDVLDQAAANAKARFADQPHRLRSVLKLIGDAYADLSQMTKAAGVAEQLVELQRDIAGADDRLTIQYATSLAGRLRTIDLERAESILRSSLTKQRRLLGEEDIDTLYTTSILGDVLQMRGKHQEAREVLKGAIETYRQGIRDQSESHYPGALSFLAGSYLAERDYENALPVLEEWKLATAARPVHHPSSLALLHVHAQILSNTGRHDEAIPIYRSAVDAAGDFYQKNDWRVAILRIGLSRSLRAKGEFAEAMLVGMQGYDSLKAQLGYNDFTVEQAVGSVIAAAVELGEREQELALRRDALILRLRIAGPDQEDGIVSRFNEYVRLLEELHGAEAVGEFRAEFTRYGVEIEPDDFRRGHFLSNWGWIQWQQDDAPDYGAEIEQLLVEGHEHIEAHFNEPEAKPWARKRVVDYLRSIGKDDLATRYTTASE